VRPAGRGGRGAKGGGGRRVEEGGREDTQNNGLYRIRPELRRGGSVQLAHLFL